MKKKIVAVLLGLCLGASLFACSGDSQNTNSADSKTEASSESENIIETTFSSDFSDGNTTSITYHEINFELPINWEEGDSTTDMLYFYPDNGMLAIGYENNGGDLSDQEDKDLFASSFLETLDDSVLIDQNNTTTGMMDVDSVVFDFEFTNNDKLFYGKCSAFNVNSDIYCFLLATEASSQINYEKDYQKVLSSILTPIETTDIPDISPASTPEPTVLATPTPEVAEVSADCKNALVQAESYSSIMHMSKQGIYDQLVSEYGGQFSAEAAQYAIDNVSADWNANALAKAAEYSDTMYMSKQGIYDQLTSEYGEQFTAEEAQYAIDNLQTDYNRNALEKAKSYQETMNMSTEAIRDQLTSEYGEQFTPEEAEYAIQNLNN